MVKIILSSQKYLLTAANQTECSRLKQRSVIRYFVAVSANYEKFTERCVMFTKNVLVKKCLQMFQTWDYHKKPESKKQSIEEKYTHYPEKTKSGGSGQ